MGTPIRRYTGDLVKSRPAVSAGIAVTGVPAATLGDVHEPVPGGARGTARGTAHRILPARPVLSVRFPEPSVQLARTVHGTVLMVRRRSTVRFRNGAPSSDAFSANST